MALDDGVDRRVVEVGHERGPDDARTGVLALGGELVHRRVGHRADHVGERRRDRAERRHRGGAVVERARVDRHDDDGRHADGLRRHERRGRQAHHERDLGQLLGRRDRRVDEVAQHLRRQRQDEHAARDHVDRVEPVAEARGDAEVAAATADGPEQVGVRGLAHGDEPAVGGHEVHLDQAVDRQAVLAGQPADATAEGQAPEADRAGVAERRREAVLSGGRACTRRRSRRPGPSRFRRTGSMSIAAHRAQVDEQPVGRRVAGDAVAAALDRDLEAELTCGRHGARDVDRALRPHDHGRLAQEVGVVDAAGLVVARVARDEDATRDRRAQRTQVGARQRGLRGGDRRDGAGRRDGSGGGGGEVRHRGRLLGRSGGSVDLVDR